VAIAGEANVYVLELVGSLRSNLSKNALTLISEGYLIPLESQSPPLQANYEVLIPILLQKAINDKHFIRAEAEACLANITANAVCNELVLVLK
jgi:hypothetical protein